MIGIYKAAIISFFLPVLSCLFAIFMPDIQRFFNYLCVAIILFNGFAYLFMLVIYKKKKRENAARLVILFNMMAFCFFLSVPLIKAFHGFTFVQLFLVVIFWLMIPLGIYDQKQQIPLVFPDNKEQDNRFSLVFYAIPVVLVFIGGGGNIIVVRELTNIFGDNLVTYYGGALIYIFGCWLAFFFQSLFYKGFVKDGKLVK